MARAPLRAEGAALAAAQVSLRPAEGDDEPFLRDLFRVLRWDEFAALGWPDDQRSRFIDLQFNYRKRHYDAAFGTAELYVVTHGPTPIGQFHVDRDGRALHVVDISLLPEWRGRGIGAALLALLQAEVRAGRGEAVRLEVAVGNPAERLYRRLGFVEIPPEDDLPRISREMTWRPG